MDGKSFNSPNVAANGSTLQNETGGNQHGPSAELPPPYSEVPQFQVENPAVIHNPTVQQHNPQGTNVGYPSFSYPGGNQQPPFQFQPPAGQHGGYFPYNSTAVPSRPVVLSEGETRRRQEAAIRHGIAAAVVRSRPIVRRRSCTYRLARLGVMLFLMGVTLLVVLGVLIVHPALNDTQLKSSWCKVIFSDMTGGEKSCDCGRYCSSTYPCLQIQVVYDNGEGNTAYLYEDVYVDKNKCSTQPCDSSEWSNENDVRDFMDEYGQVGNRYRCYYNPKTPDEAFKTRSSVNSDQMKILHCVLWPMLLIAISIGLLLTLFCRSKGHCCFVKRNDSSVPYGTLQPRA